MAIARVPARQPPREGQDSLDCLRELWPATGLRFRHRSCNSLDVGVQVSARAGVHDSARIGLSMPYNGRVPRSAGRYSRTSRSRKRTWTPPRERCLALTTDTLSMPALILRSFDLLPSLGLNTQRVMNAFPSCRRPRAYATLSAGSQRPCCFIVLAERVRFELTSPVKDCRFSRRMAHAYPQVFACKCIIARYCFVGQCAATNCGELVPSAT